VNCPSCGHENRAGARFCDSCGLALAASCPACGTELRADARFCDSCGAAVAADTQASGETRKTVSVVFADMVGSTSLQEKLDPESVRRVMARFYESMTAAIESHGGEVEKFIGDAVVARWGAREVREDDALRAVRAAADMRDALGELNDQLEADWGVTLGLRTGVNTGELVISAGDSIMVGDTMNTAARLEQNAEAGQILIGEPTWRLVRHDVTLEPVEPLALKGKSEPVPAWRLVSLDPPADRDASRMDAPLVGREAELDRLKAVFEEARASGGCRLATVIGSPGLGKTRLAHELATLVSAEATVLSGHCEPMSEGATFLPVAEVLRQAAALDETDAAEAVREKLAALLPEDSERDRVLECLASLLGLAPPASPEETFWAVRRLFEALARERPLVAILDDVHWAEPTFLDLIEHLAEWVRNAPILLVVLARPELREARSALAETRRAAEVVDLGPLKAEDSHRLAAELLDRADLPAELAERVLEATEGNPLFLGEMLRMLVDDGMLRREGDAWVAAGDLSTVEVPPTINALLATRIERLGGEERSVVERASVIGRQFYRGAVAELAPGPGAQALGEVDSHLETLRRKELVEPEGTYWIDEPIFRFHHVLIRDAAYRALLKEARAELHERFADWLESKAGDLVGEYEEVVGFHLEQAHEYRRQLGPLDGHGEALGARAAERLASAGRRALAREDLPAASNLLGRALGVLEPAVHERAEILVDLAEALLSAGDTARGADAVEQLRAAAGDDVRLQARAAIAAGQLSTLTDATRLRETVAEAQEAAAVLAEAGDEAGVAKAHHVEAGALARLGQVAAVEAALDQALASARKAGDARRITAVLSGAPLAALWGPSPVVRASGRCLDVVRILRMTAGNRHVEAAALRCQAVLEAMRGRPDAARTMLDGCRTTLEELGLRFGLLETEVHAGIVELLDGDDAAAEAHLRLAYEGFSDLGVDSGAAEAAALLARALLAQERGDEAEELTRVSEARGGEDLKTRIAWSGVRAQVLARRGEHAAAEELVRQAIGLAEQTDALTDHADARMALASVLRAADREAEAVSEAERALGLYEQKGNEAGAASVREFLGLSAAVPDTLEQERLGDRPALVPQGDDTSVVQTFRAWLQAVNARDWDGARGLMSDQFVGRDRRTASPLAPKVDAATWLERIRSLAASAEDAHASIDEVLVRDARVMAFRFSWRGHWSDGRGAFEIPMRSLAVAEAGRCTRIENFDPDDDGVLDRYRELSTGTADEAVMAGLKRLVDAFNSRDWDAFRAVFTTDAVFENRRRPSSWETADLDRWVELQQALVANSEDIRYGPDPFEIVGDVAFARLHMTGRWNEGGGEFTIPTPGVARFRGEQLAWLSVFDPDDEDEARRLFDQLVQVTTDSPRESFAHFVELYNAHDWEGMGGVIHEDVTLVDHRTVGWGTVEGLEDLKTRWPTAVEAAPDIAIVSPEIVAEAEAAIFARYTVAGHLAEGGGLAEFGILNVTKLEGGKAQRIELFDPDDEVAAFARFEELSLERRATRRSYHERWQARWAELFNTRDPKALAQELMHPEIVVVDHRFSSAEPIVGSEAFVETLDSMLAMAPPDFSAESEVLDSIGEIVLARNTYRGSGADVGDGVVSGPFEVSMYVVAEHRDGVSVQAHFFDEEPAARSKFEELGSAETSDELSREEAEAIAERFQRAVNEQDWETLRDLYAEDFVQEEQRALAWETLRGPDAMLELWRSLFEFSPDFRGDAKVIGTEGNRLASQHVFRGTSKDPEAPWESKAGFIAEVRDGRFVRAERYSDVGDEVLLERLRSPTGDASYEHGRWAARWQELWNAHNPDAVIDELVDPEVVWADHRQLGYERAEGAEQYAKNMKSLFASAPDAKLEKKVLESRGDLALHMNRYYGAGDSGGAGEWEAVFYPVAEIREGRLVRVDTFDDEEVARAAFIASVAAQLIDQQNWEAWESLLSEDYFQRDHRSAPLWNSEGREEAMEHWRATAALVSSYNFPAEILDAKAGRVLRRLIVSGQWVQEGGGGHWSIPVYDVLHVRDGRVSGVEIYEGDADGLAAARAEFEKETPSATEASARAEHDHWLARWVELCNARDVRRLADELFHPQVVVIDHRSMGAEPITSPDAYAEMMKIVFDASSELAVEAEWLHSEGDLLLCTSRYTGTARVAAGAAFELEVFEVCEIRDGLLIRDDMFETQSIARAAFACRVLLRNVIDGEWEAVRQALVEDFRMRDHRAMRLWDADDRDETIRQLQSIAPMIEGLSYNEELVAVSPGAVLVATRATGRDRAGGADVELSNLHVYRTDGGRFIELDIFDSDEAGLAAARARFEELSG
jgi:class 3 adenylate cyclase/ketosteroid isomerase-like protein/tetratricopeptide (TPR) repeat protein